MRFHDLDVTSTAALILVTLNNVLSQVITKIGCTAMTFGVTFPYKLLSLRTKPPFLSGRGMNDSKIIFFSED